MDSVSINMQIFFTIILNVLQNEKLLEIVYEIDWYLLPIEDQRMVLLLLMKTQNCTEMWIGWFAPLNVESGFAVSVIYTTYILQIFNSLVLIVILQVLKTIYQSFMFMLNVLYE